MAFDNANNLIVTDEGAHQVRKISPRGDVTTIAGAGESEPFNSPTGIAIDQATGLIYIADTLQNVIRTFDPATNKIDVFAGAVGKRENSDGPRLSGAAFKSPGSLAFYGGSSGVLYVLDSLHDSYLMRNFEDKTTSKVGDRFARIAGLSKSNGGERVETLATATEDDYQYPFNFAASTSGLAVGPDGTVYIADFYNKRIVKYTEQLGAVRFADFPYLFPAGILAAAFPEPSLLVATQFFFATPLARISLSSGAQSGTLLSMPGVVGFGSRDGIFDLNDNDGGAALAPFFLASNSNGTVFVGHRKHNKVMRIGLLRGAACNLSIPAHSPQHVCSPGTYVDWDSYTCRACQDSLSRDTFPFSSYCMNAAGNAVSGGTVTTTTAQGASHTYDTATEVGLWFAILLIAGVAGLLVACVIVRRTRSLDALHRRPGQDEAMSVLVSSINLVQRESFRGLSPLSMAATMQAAASSNTAAAGSASTSSAGAAAAVPASANVSSLAFTDLLPDSATLPLFGGFGVVFSARWVSRGGLRVAVKVPKDLVVSGYLPPAAAAELVKEAQGLVRASDNLANEFVVRLFGVAQGDGGAAWAAACERARALHFARKSGSSDSATIAESDPGAASASAAPTPAAGFNLLGLVMAFEEGGTLADQLQPPPSLLRPAWPASMADRLRVARELVQGLWHLHRVGIVHGDLKLENVLLSGGAERHVRLADFGLSELRSVADSAAFAQSRVSTAIVADKKRGTWPYMAPEMFPGPGHKALAASRGTDVFALGTLLWEVMTGCEPWAASRASADPVAVRLADVRAGKMLDLARLPADTPLAVARLIADCTALDRAKRPRMGRVRAVLEQAHDEHLGGRFDVFLSHAWGMGDARKPFTDALYFSLKESGLRVWLDSNEMGHNLVSSMADGIAKSDVMLALLSPDYERSRQCMFELRYASGLVATEGEAQREALVGRLAAAQSEAEAMQARAVRAEEAAAARAADAAIKTEGRARSVAAAQVLADLEVLEFSINLLRAAKASEERVRAEGALAVAAAHAAAETAAKAVCSARDDVEHDTAIRAALKGGTAGAPCSAVPALAVCRPIVACIVEPRLWKVEGWAPGEELKALAGLSTALYADASAAAGVAWQAETVSDADRRLLTHDAKALPRILELVAAARKKAAAEGVPAAAGSGSGGAGSRGTPPASTASPRSSK